LLLLLLFLLLAGDLLAEMREEIDSIPLWFERADQNKKGEADDVSLHRHIGQRHAGDEKYRDDKPAAKHCYAMDRREINRNQYYCHVAEEN